MQARVNNQHAGRPGLAAAPRTRGRRAAGASVVPRAGARAGPDAAVSGGIDLPEGRQPFFKVLSQLRSPRTYFELVLRGRAAAVGQVGCGDLPEGQAGSWVLCAA